MHKTVQILSVVVSSPSDGLSEREAILKVIQRINRMLELMGKPYQLAFKDQKSIRPEAGNPQRVADAQLQIKNCHIFIAIFGLRFGSVTGLNRPDDGTPYLSGTEKEVEDAFVSQSENDGRRPSIMLYRKNMPTPAGMTEEQIKQYYRVIEFFEKCKAGAKHPAFYFSFEPAEFEQNLEDHILQTCTDHEKEWLEEELLSDSIRSFPAGNHPTPVHPGNAEIEPIKNRWALLVGANQFIDPSCPNLNYCVADAQALAESLTRQGYTTVCLSDEAEAEYQKPDFQNVDAEIKNMLHVAGKNDLIWFHFACHGVLRQRKPYLVFHNSRLPNLDRTGLALEYLVQLVQESNNKRVILTLDACHMGIDIGRGSALSDPGFIRRTCELAQGLAIISASTSQQTSQEYHSIHHGLFTYHLLKGLEGKADLAGRNLITVNDLFTYVVDNLRKWMIKTGTAIQEPNLRIWTTGDMILVDFRKSVK